MAETMEAEIVLMETKVTLFTAVFFTGTGRNNTSKLLAQQIQFKTKQTGKRSFSYV